MLQDLESLKQLQVADKEILRLREEIAALPKRVAAIEEKLAATRAKLEKAKAAAKADEAALKAETAEIEKEKEQARQRTTEDETLLAEWNAKRDGLRAGVDPDTLRRYERVMKYRGSGLSEVRDQKCTACQVMLRPQTYNDVRSGQKIIECESCQRLLYFNPENEVKTEKASVSHRRRAKPKVDSQQAWFYHPAYGETGEVYLAFINSNTTSSRRVYELHTGRQIGDILNREGSFRLAFPEDLNGVIRLNGQWDEEEIDSWGAELPMVVLDTLQRDLDLARAESTHSTHAAAAETPSEHPAAS